MSGRKSLTVMPRRRLGEKHRAAEQNVQDQGQCRPADGQDQRDRDEAENPGRGGMDGGQTDKGDDPEQGDKKAQENRRCP
jgi:hypothetical protein